MGEIKIVKSRILTFEVLNRIFAYGMVPLLILLMEQFLTGIVPGIWIVSIIFWGLYFLLIQIRVVQHFELMKIDNWNLIPLFSTQHKVRYQDAWKIFVRSFFRAVWTILAIILMTNLIVYLVGEIPLGGIGEYSFEREWWRQLVILWVGGGVLSFSLVDFFVGLEIRLGQGNRVLDRFLPIIKNLKF